jgi:hypothetical protein
MDSRRAVAIVLFFGRRPDAEQDNSVVWLASGQDRFVTLQQQLFSNPFNCIAVLVRGIGEGN